MKKLRRILKSSKGSTNISTVVVAMILIVIVASGLEYLRLNVIAQGTRNGMETVITQVCTDNYDRLYNGLREGYSGGYKLDSGRLAALDMRLADPSAEDYEGSKINLAVQNIYDIWQRSGDVTGAQMVFCDLSTPHYDGKFNVYDDMKQKLIQLGIPEQEIKFIHDAKTEKQKEALFAAVRSGKIRVILGSTTLMGAGTNAQKHLIALHHMDAPWRPSDVEQREGRILRQGNGNAEVEIYRYVTEGTFDAYSWVRREVA